MNKRILNGLLAIGVVFGTGGCEEISYLDFDRPRLFLLEIEVVNYAWVPTYFGFVLDSDGNIYRYDRQGQPWEQQTSYTPNQLSEKFAPGRQLVTTRDSSEVAAVASKIAAAIDGSLSSLKAECADAGAFTYRAYEYVPSLNTYRPVLLRTEGDYAQQNLAQAAQELIAYIRSLALLQELPGCDP